MPISNGFGRYIPRRWKSTSPEKSVKSYSPTNTTRIQPVFVEDTSTPKHLYEVYPNNSYFQPPDRITEEKLVIVKPVTVETIENVPAAPKYIVEKQPKYQSKRFEYETIELQRTTKSRCCKSIYDVDECQCFDCTNGRCCKPCAWLGSMCACPVWLWILLGLLLLGLLGTLIAFLVESPLVNPAKRVYKYIYGTDYYNRQMNLTEIYYAEGPCASVAPDVGTTTAFPLCNQTTTKLLGTRMNLVVVQNKVIYNSAKYLCRGVFVILFELFISVLFLTSFI